VNGHARALSNKESVERVETERADQLLSEVVWAQKSDEAVEATGNEAEQVKVRVG
jgi:hypothetical protein